MDKLTKENFWNDLYAKYPEQMKQFCAWIDEYKKRVEWDLLFREGKYGGEYAQPTKYHHLPIAMQIGIFLQYVAETENWGGFDLPSINGMAAFAVIPQYIQEFFEYENSIQTHNAPVHAIRLQSDAAAAQDTDQADIEGADGRGDAANEEGARPVDVGSAQKS